MSRGRAHLLLVGTLIAALGMTDAARAGEPRRPRFRLFTGLVGGDARRFIVTQEFWLPLVQAGRVDASYLHRETTPFIALPGQLQTELLRTSDRLRLGVAATRRLRLLAVIGYEASHQLDGSQRAGAYALGGGADSGRPGNDDRLEWSVLLGTYANRHGVTPRWWSELHVRWRPVELGEVRYLESTYRMSVALVADVEAARQPGRTRGLYQLGPALEIRNASGNGVEVRFQRYVNDDHPFYGARAHGWLLGANMTSSWEARGPVSASTERRSGTFPLWWGALEIGAGGDRSLTRMELTLEMVDFLVAGRTWTATFHTETRQERRPEGLGTVSYLLRGGVQTRLRAKRPSPADNPLMIGVSVLHRSDHARDPRPERFIGRGTVTSIGKLLDSAGLNVADVRLRTAGWDLPYRAGSAGSTRRGWQERLDFLVAAGVDIGSERDRGTLAGQIGINWDFASRGGFTPYLRGIASLGNETPDWLLELGARHGILTVFLRGEEYGFRPDMGAGSTFWIGVAAGL